VEGECEVGEAEDVDPLGTQDLVTAAAAALLIERRAGPDLLGALSGQRPIVKTTTDPLDQRDALLPMEDRDATTVTSSRPSISRSIDRHRG
jgi:hypothetical protein